MEKITVQKRDCSLRSQIYFLNLLPFLLCRYQGTVTLGKLAIILFGL